MTDHGGIIGARAVPRGHARIGPRRCDRIAASGQGAPRAMPAERQAAVPAAGLAAGAVGGCARKRAVARISTSLGIGAVGAVQLRLKLVLLSSGVITSA